MTQSTAIRSDAASSNRRDVFVQRNFSMDPFDGQSERAMKDHLGLYAGYVKQASAIEHALRDGNIGSGMAVLRPRETLARRLAFEANGVRLHELFFEQFVMSDRAGDGGFGRCVEDAYGSPEAWRADVKALGEARGPGWIVTTLDPGTGAVQNYWIDLHHLNTPANQTILFVLDLWEHAYWTDFGAAGRPKYIEAVLNGTKWPVIDARARGMSQQVPTAGS